MIRELTRNIGNFVFLILLQVLILNHIRFNGFINPYFYVLFILVLPFEIPKWLLLVASFFLGLIVDLFMQTWGLHTFASVFAGYVRPYLLKIIAPRDGYESGLSPGIKSFGFEWFVVKYSLIIVFVHHFVLFFLETFKFHQFFSTLLRVVLSTIFTLILIILSQFLIQKR